MYYLRNFDKQADAVGQKAYLPTIAIVGGVNKVGYFDGDASKDNVFSEDGNFINVEEKETRVVCTYNVTSTTEATKLLYTGLTLSNIASMEVDGVNTTVATGYTFTTTGEHTVKFTFKDNTTISDFAFFNCTGLTSATIPSCVINIGDRAFYNTPWYKSYSADTANQYGNIIYINNVAYQPITTGITSCEFKEGTVGIGNKAFLNCTGLTSVVIPDSVTTIGDYAFDSCTSLTSVTIPDSVTKIGYSTFGSCEGLTSVTIPDSVTSIGDAAFSNCFRLTSITIPDSVTSIGSDTFRDCI